jgi:hypothetical protein
LPLELRTWILTDRSLRSISCLTGVRGAAHVDEQATIKPGDDRVGRAGRPQRARLERIAEHGVIWREVNEAISQGDPGRAALAEALHHVGPSVAIVVSERQQAAVLSLSAPSSQGDQDVPVRGHDEMPAAADRLRYDDGTEAGWKLEPAVPRVTPGVLGCAAVHSRPEKQQGSHDRYLTRDPAHYRHLLGLAA